MFKSIYIYPAFYIIAGWLVSGEITPRIAPVYQVYGSPLLLFSHKNLTRQQILKYIEILKTGNLPEKNTAAEQLAFRGGKAVVSLIMDLLKSENTADRITASWVLGVLKDRKAIAALITSSRDTDWEVRRNSVLSLADIGGIEAARAISKRLGDPHLLVRKAAIIGLKKLRATVSEKSILVRLSRQMKIETDETLLTEMADLVFPIRHPVLRELAVNLMSHPGHFLKIYGALILLNQGNQQGLRIILPYFSKAGPVFYQLEILRLAKRLSLPVVRTVLVRGIAHKSATVRLVSAEILCEKGECPALCQLLQTGNFKSRLSTRCQ